MGELDCSFGPTRRTGEFDGVFGPTRPFGELDGVSGPIRPFGELEDGCFRCSGSVCPRPRVTFLGYLLCESFSELLRNSI